MLTPIRLLFLVVFIFLFLLLVKTVMDNRDAVGVDEIETGMLSGHLQAA